jgi:DNA-binding GntR family transcriptional regulator
MDTGRFTEPNAGRYTRPSTSPSSPDPSTVGAAGEADATTAVGHAYASIKRALLFGEYSLGARLVEERVARRIGVSRTPVREALLRLHTEGLVTKHPGGGYSPTVPNIAEVRELYEVRAALEHAAMYRPRTSGRPHDAAALTSLRDDWVALGASTTPASPEFVEHDEAFHVRLAAASGNRELAVLLQRVNERIRIVRMRDFLTGDRITQTIEEHLGLLDLVLAGDLDGAVEAYGAHVQASFDVVEQRVAGALLQMAANR